MTTISSEFDTNDAVLPRFLAWMGDAPGTSVSRELFAFRFLVLLHATVQSWAWLILTKRGEMEMSSTPLMGASMLFTVSCMIALTPYARLAPCLALPACLWQLYGTFPWTANHNFLVIVCVVLLALLDPKRDDESTFLMQCLRWITVVVFFYAGLQKMLYGYWFRGEYLSWAISHGTDAWSAAFAWIVPADEIRRLQTLAPYDENSGPYRIASIPFILISNAIYLGEMLLAVLLCVRRTRVIAATAAIALVFVIQIGPREFMFALLYTQLLLLFVPGNWNWRLAPVLAIGYIYLLAVLGGVAPGEFLIKASGDI